MSETMDTFLRWVIIVCVGLSFLRWTMADFIISIRQAYAKDVTEKKEEKKADEETHSLPG